MGQGGTPGRRRPRPGTVQSPARDAGPARARVSARAPHWQAVRTVGPELSLSLSLTTGHGHADRASDSDSLAGRGRAGGTRPGRGRPPAARPGSAAAGRLAEPPARRPLSAGRRAPEAVCRRGAAARAGLCSPPRLTGCGPARLGPSVSDSEFEVRIRCTAPARHSFDQSESQCTKFCCCLLTVRV
jgi:hypothetical protein